jgi:hypothetical protein
MPARIVDLANPDLSGTLYEGEEEASQALAAMVKNFRSHGYTVTEQILSGEDHAQYKVVDQTDEWIGTYTIILE